MSIYKEKRNNFVVNCYFVIGYGIYWVNPIIAAVLITALAIYYLKVELRINNLELNKK